MFSTSSSALLRFCRLPVVVLIVTLIGGCGASAVGARFSAEFNCPSDSVSVGALGAGAFRARGCGRDVTYVCVTNGWGESLCATDTVRAANAPRPAVAAAPHRPSALRRSQITGAFAPAGDAILACLPGATVVELRLYVLSSGVLYDFRTPRQLELPAWHCVRAALDAHRAPAAPGPARVVMAMAFRASTPALPESGVPEQNRNVLNDPSGANSAPNEVRIWLDSQRDAILTCAERSTALVKARWDLDGEVSLGFGGDLAGTTAEGCLQSALGTHHVTAGATGELSHLVR